MAVKVESLYERLHEDQIGAPPDVVLEANKVEEALVEANIYTQLFK